MGQYEAIDALRFIANNTTDRGSWAVARRALRRLGQPEAGDDNPVSAIATDDTPRGQSE